MQTFARLNSAVDALLALGFAARCNPWRHLGALTAWALVITLVSGVIAYALYDTSIAGAYRSGLRLEQEGTGMGALLRGIHRYGADAFLVLMMLHLLRELLKGRHRGAHWFSWVSGVPLLALAWVAGLSGLWLLWDARALATVIATAEWLQVLPSLGDGIARNFLAAGSLNDRFFSLIIFMHIGVPLFLLGATWVHLQRLRHAALWPAGASRVVFLALLLVLAWVVPVRSLGPADLHQVPATLRADWFYQFPLVLVDVTHPALAWLLAATMFAGLLLLPWLTRRSAGTPPVPVAVVDPANCNGCSRCAADCPSGAIRMIGRADGSRHLALAEVDASLCLSCGICVGACPSSTPFRRGERLLSGIEMPHRPVDSLRKMLLQGLMQRAAAETVLLCSCAPAHATRPHSDAARTGLLSMVVECVGMLPPSFIDFALRQGVAGVIVAGCAECDCAFRLGDRWTTERMAGLREPHLRRIVPRERIQLLWGASEHEIARAAARLSPTLPTPMSATS